MGISKIVIEIWKTTYEYKYNRLDVQCKLDWELLNCPQDNTLQCTQDHFEVNCSTNSMHAWAFVQDYNEELMKIDTCEIWQWWHENEWKWSGSSKNDMTSTCYLLSSSLISLQTFGYPFKCFQLTFECSDAWLMHISQSDYFHKEQMCVEDVPFLLTNWC